MPTPDRPWFGLDVAHQTRRRSAMQSLCGGGKRGDEARRYRQELLWGQACRQVCHLAIAMVTTSPQHHNRCGKIRSLLHPSGCLLTSWGWPCSRPPPAKDLSTLPCNMSPLICPQVLPAMIGESVLKTGMQRPGPTGKPKMRGCRFRLSCASHRLPLSAAHRSAPCKWRGKAAIRRAIVQP